MTTIGIAVVLHQGRVLTGIRGPNGPLPGLAEFPGGKCRPGESPAGCAIREAAEETGLRIDVVEPLQELEWTYPHGAVRLHFFLCRPADASDVAGEQEPFVWTPVEELARLEFPEANAVVIRRLQDRFASRSPAQRGMA